MSTAEILAELPKLSFEERDEIHRRLLEIDEQYVLGGPGPTEVEKQLLDEAWEDFEKSGEVPMPWREFMESLKKPASL